MKVKLQLIFTLYNSGHFSIHIMQLDIQIWLFIIINHFQVVSYYQFLVIHHFQVFGYYQFLELSLVSQQPHMVGFSGLNRFRRISDMVRSQDLAISQYLHMAGFSRLSRFSWNLRYGQILGIKLFLSILIWLDFRIWSFL